MNQEKTKRVAVVGIPDFCRFSVFELCRQGARRVGDDDMELCYAASEVSKEMGHLAKERCDGAITGITSPRAAQLASAMPFPVVNISSWLAQPGVATVRRDDEGLGRLAAEHLLQKGFRRVGVVLAPGGWYMKARYDGAVKALLAAGVKPCVFNGFAFGQCACLSPRRCRQAVTRSNYFQGVQKWLGTLRPPVGIICLDDGLALGVLSGCRATGLRVPHDVGVVTTNNEPHAVDDPALPLRLSSVEPNEVEVKRRAGQLLAELMCGRIAGRPIITVLPAGVVQRESTDVQVCDHPLLAGAVMFVRGHLDEGINVAELARHLKVSRATLERHCRDATGMSPHELIINIRMDVAKKLLSDPTAKLAYVASKCGFWDRQHFNSVFVRRTGMSPDAWRKSRGM